MKTIPKKLFKGLIKDKTADTLTAFATVEVKDREGDIIRVAGMDFAHTDQSTLKVYGTTHSYKSLPDGMPPIIGVVKQFVKTATEVGGATVPAVVFEMAWAKDGEQLTDYAAKFKGMYDSGTLDSFSVGVDPLQYTRLKGGRYDVTKSSCFEISASPLPVNRYATVIKSWKEALGDDVDSAEILEDRMIEILKSIDRQDKRDDLLMQRFDALESSLTTLLKGAARPPRGDTEQSDEVAKLMKSLQGLLQTAPYFTHKQNKESL